jgi:hypothetical protein
VDFPLDFFDEDFNLKLIYRKMGEVGFIKSYKIFNQNRTLLEISDIEFEFDYNYQSFINQESGYNYNFSFDIEYVKGFVYKEKIIGKNSKSKIDEKPEDFLLYNYYVRDQENKNWIDIYKSKYKTDDIKEDLLLIETNKVFQKVQIDNYQLKNKNTDLFTECFRDNNEPLIFWKEQYGVGKALSNQFKSDLFKNKGEGNFFDDSVIVDIEEENFNIFRRIVIRNIENTFDKLKYSIKNIDFLSAQRSILNGEIDIIAKQFSNLYFDIDIRFLKKSLEILGINGELKVDRIQGRYTTISLIQNEKKTNIVDLGYGYSKVLPIILKIIVSNHLHETNKASITDEAINESPSFTDYNDSLRPILIIEEPEANLHPNLQSKLADIFVLAYKMFGTHFIIESHSEYFIRKLQYLTAKKEINQDNSIIYYFNADEFVNAKEPKVKEIFIDEFGGLSDTFGPGFFDEATDLKFQLMKLNQAQRN